MNALNFYLYIIYFIKYYVYSTNISTYLLILDFRIHTFHSLFNCNLYIDYKTCIILYMVLIIKISYISYLLKVNLYQMNNFYGIY